MGVQRRVSPRRAARERAPPPKCAPRLQCRGGALSSTSRPAGASLGTVCGEGRGSGCPPRVWGRLPAPGPMECQPKGAILDKVPRRLLGPRTQSTAWHVGPPRNASAPWPFPLSLPRSPLPLPPPASSTMSHLTPLGPFPSRCKYTGAPPIKTAGGSVGGGGAGVVGCGSLAVLCLPGWQEVWEGVVELAHQGRPQLASPDTRPSHPGRWSGRAPAQVDCMPGPDSEVHVYLRSPDGSGNP